MNLNEALSHVGGRAIWLAFNTRDGPPWCIPVKTTDARELMGRIELLCQPVATGTTGEPRWINVNNVEFL